MLTNPFEFWFAFMFTVVLTPFFVLGIFQPIFDIDPYSIRSIEEFDRMRADNRKAFWILYVGLLMICSLVLFLVEFISAGGLLGR